MPVLYERCAGLDVHKKTVVVCVMLSDAGGQASRQVRTFATTTESLLRLADWLTSQQVSHVAMESTGVYWRPIFNILEAAFQVILVNAQHMKAIPGRKTDVRDSEWLADRLATRAAQRFLHSATAHPGSAGSGSLSPVAGSGALTRGQSRPKSARNGQYQAVVSGRARSWGSVGKP